MIVFAAPFVFHLFKSDKCYNFAINSQAAQGLIDADAAERGELRDAGAAGLSSVCSTCEVQAQSKGKMR